MLQKLSTAAVLFSSLAFTSAFAQQDNRAEQLDPNCTVNCALRALPTPPPPPAPPPPSPVTISPGQANCPPGTTYHPSTCVNTATTTCNAEAVGCY
jgi:hypothetical protein